jgi:hypothetical protein
MTVSFRFFTFRDGSAIQETLSRFRLPAVQRNFTELPFDGLFSRESDIVQLEAYLLLYKNIALLRGGYGEGKTFLIEKLMFWWKRTKFIEATVLFSEKNIPSSNIEGVL